MAAPRRSRMSHLEGRSTVSREQWLEARKALLAREKELTRLRDELVLQRRALPWVRIDKAYVFEAVRGKESLAELFAGRSQLLGASTGFRPRRVTSTATSESRSARRSSPSGDPSTTSGRCRSAWKRR